MFYQSSFRKICWLLKSYFHIRGRHKVPHSAAWIWPGSKAAKADLDLCGWWPLCIWEKLFKSGRRTCCNIEKGRVQILQSSSVISLPCCGLVYQNWTLRKNCCAWGYQTKQIGGNRLLLTSEKPQKVQARRRDYEGLPLRTSIWLNNYTILSLSPPLSLPTYHTPSQSICPLQG